MNDYIKGKSMETALDSDEMWAGIMGEGPAMSDSMAKKKDDIAFANRLDVDALLKKPKKQTQASKQGTINQKKGSAAQEKAKLHFERAGYKNVYVIHTPKNIRKVGGVSMNYATGAIQHHPKGSPLFTIAAMLRARGDLTGTKNGIAFLAEVKDHDAETLPWGQLTRRLSGGTYHQSENLNGFLFADPLCNAYLVWTRPRKCAIMDWREVWASGFDKPRQSIKWDDAWEMRMNKK